jgi:hypothetical protein
VHQQDRIALAFVEIGNFNIAVENSASTVPYGF